MDLENKKKVSKEGKFYSTNIYFTAIRGNADFLEILAGSHVLSEKDIKFKISIHKPNRDNPLLIKLKFEKNIVFKDLDMILKIRGKMLTCKLLDDNELQTDPSCYTFKTDSDNVDIQGILSNQDNKIFIFYNFYSEIGFEKIMFQKDMVEHKFCDMTITTEDDTVFNVHKAILCNSSTVFKKIIESKMKESLTSNINLYGFDTNVIKELINYIYDKNYDLSVGVNSMFQLAHMYQMDNLKNECEEYMSRFMSKENISDILKLLNLNLYPLKNLRYKVMKFINLHTELAQDENFVKCYLDTMTSSNIHVIFSFAMRCSNQNFKNNVKKFINQNAKEVFKNEEFRKILTAEWSLELFDFIIDNSSSMEGM